ncbi:MAG: hypothetical protein JSS07_12230 [Proteobacteria bacterium]|nr:hypothetical protein [Pseudomonadota bacterium]
MLRTAVEIINQRYPEHIRRFASAQYLASFSYQLAKLPTLPAFAEILTTAGSFKVYHLKAFNLKKGLYAYLLLPQNKSEKEVRIVFRGTNFKDFNSAAINFEPQGPGVASFNAEKNNILNTLKKTIKDYYGSDATAITLDVCGHSQGAALTQLLVSEFVQERNKCNDFDNISTVNMTAFNSPGIPTAIVNLAEQAVLGQWLDDRPLKIQANFGMVGGDAIQLTGENMVFAKLPSFIVKASLLKVKKELEGLWLKAFNLSDGIQPIEIYNCVINFIAALHGAHSSVNYYAPLDVKGKITVDYEYDYFTNDNPETHNKLLKEVLNKAKYIQRLLYVPKIILHYFLAHHDDYRQFSLMGFVRNSFGEQRVTNWYKKMSDWLNPPQKDTEFAPVQPQMVPIELYNEQAICCCPQFSSMKTNQFLCFETEDRANTVAPLLRNSSNLS